MKTILLVSIIVIVAVSVISISLLYNQEITTFPGMMTSDEKPEPALPDPICFVIGKATSSEKGEAVTSEACFPLSDFENLGCDRRVLEYIYKHTNLLDKEEALVQLRNSIGLPEGVSEEKYEKCADAIYMKRATMSESDKPTGENTIVYPAFENGVIEIVNPEHEPLTYHAMTPVIDDTYLSKNVQQWTNAWPHELDAEYQKYRDEFYIELGRLLMKNEMQYQMNSLGIKNANDDFKVISGVSLDSLPPHIGFSTVIHATDGHYYWLQGSTLANKVSYYKTTQLQYPNPITVNPVTKPGETLPRISIQMKGNNDLKSVPPFVVLYNPGEVEFYNETPETLFISIDKDGLSEHGSEQTQEIWTRSDSGATWPFSEPGAYSWRGKIQTIIDNKEYDLSTGGGVLVLSDDMDNLSRTEQMETARMILITSGLPIVGIGQKGEDDTLYISLDYAIEELLPESRQYYLQKAQQLIPFDIAIKLDKG